MWRTNLFIKIVFIVIFFCNCSGHSYDSFLEDTIQISHSKHKTVAFDQFFDLNQAQFIQFEYNDSLVLSEKLIVCFTRDFMVVLDLVKTQVYRFSKYGFLLNKIGKNGVAPNEYQNAMGIQIDSIENTVDILCDGGLTVKTFDLEGGFKKSFKSPVNASSFARINSNRYWFYSGFSGSENYHRLHLADTTGRVLKSYLQLKTKAIDITEQNFYSKGSNSIFRESFFPSVYRIDSIECKEILRFDFADKGISEMDFKKVKDPFLFFDNIQRKGFLSTVHALEDNNTLYIRTIQQCSNNLELFDFFINYKDSSVIKVSTTNPVISELFHSIRLVHIDEERFYFLTSQYIIEDVIEQISTLDVWKEAFNPSGNPLLIILPRLNIECQLFDSESER